MDWSVRIAGLPMQILAGRLVWSLPQFPRVETLRGWDLLGGAGRNRPLWATCGSSSLLLTRFSCKAAWAAAKRATGTLKGLQLT
jgi:hypothetical protein